MKCRKCGGEPAWEDYAGLCFDCFAARCSALADAILAAPGPGAATLLYVDGMRALGVSEQEIRAEVVANDLAEATCSRRT